MPESLIKLHKYVAVDDVRGYMNKLVNVGGYLGAINGHAFIIDQTTKGKHYGFFDFYKTRKAPVGQKSTIEKQITDVEASLDSYVWQDMPEIKDSHYKDCHHCNDAGLVRSRGVGCGECSGDGFVLIENTFNEHEVECKSCDGHGNEYSGMETCGHCEGTKLHLEYSPILLVGDGLALNGLYVSWFSDLPDVKISWHDEYRFFVLKFTGGFGLIMPMRT